MSKELEKNMSKELEKNINGLIGNMQLGIYTLELCNQIKDKISQYLAANDPSSEDQLKFVKNVLIDLNYELKKLDGKIERFNKAPIIPFVDPYQKANVHKLMGDIYAEIGYFGEALFHYQQEEIAVSQLKNELNSDLIITGNNLIITKAEKKDDADSKVSALEVKQTRKDTAEAAFAKVGYVYLIAMKPQFATKILSQPSDDLDADWKQSFVNVDEARIKEVKVAVQKRKTELSFSDLYKEFKKCERFPINVVNPFLRSNNDLRPGKLAAYMYTMDEFKTQSDIQRAEVMISWYNSPLNDSIEDKDAIYKQLVEMNFAEINDLNVLGRSADIMFEKKNNDKAIDICEILKAKHLKSFSEYFEENYNEARIKKALNLIDQSKFDDAEAAIELATDSNAKALALVCLKLKKDPNAKLAEYEKSFIIIDNLNNTNMYLVERIKKLLPESEKNFLAKPEVIVHESSPQKSNAKKYAIAAAVGVAVCLLIIASLFIPPVAAGLAAVFGSLLVAGLVVGGSGVVIGGAAAGATLAVETALEKSAEKKMSTGISNPNASSPDEYVGKKRF